MLILATIRKKTQGGLGMFTMPALLTETPQGNKIRKKVGMSQTMVSLEDPLSSSFMCIVAGMCSKAFPF